MSGSERQEFENEKSRLRKTMSNREAPVTTFPDLAGLRKRGAFVSDSMSVADLPSGLLVARRNADPLGAVFSRGPTVTGLPTSPCFVKRGIVILNPDISVVPSTVTQQSNPGSPSRMMQIQSTPAARTGGTP
jgi:hypothetical protein